MASPELGLKRTCVSCGARFYDLTKSPAVCPKCGTEQPLDQPRIRRPIEPTPTAVPKANKADDGEVDIETDDDAEDDEDIEDASVLDDDDDADIGTEIEVNTDNDDNDH